MRVRTQEELIARNQRETRFFQVIRNIEVPLNIAPTVVKFMADEMRNLGKSFFQKSLEKFAMIDE